MGWTNPVVLTGLIGGVALLVVFCVIETRVPSPMFDLHLMRIRAFAAGVGATLLAAIARGGLQFMLIIWLQGIWLPLHGYAFKDTPLWSGIYLLAADRRLHRLRAAVGLAVGQARGARVRLRRPDRVGRRVRRAAAHPDQLRLPRVRRR